MRRAPGLIVFMADEIIPYDKTAWHLHLWATTVSRMFFVADLATLLGEWRPTGRHNYTIEKAL